MKHIELDPARLTDAVLRLRSVGVDEKAWRVIYEELQPAFARVARRAFPDDWAAAEEAVQQSFRTLFLRGAVHLVDDPARFRAYAMQLCINDVRQALRLRAQERAHDGGSLTTLALPDDEVAAVTRTASNHYVLGPEAVEIALDSVLSALPPADRAVLLLLMDGKAYRQIATELGISDTAAAVRITRLRAKVSKLLSDNALTDE